MNAYDRTLDALLVVAAQDLVNAEVETARAVETDDARISGRAQRRIRRKMKQYERELWWADVPSGYRRTVASVLVVCTVFLGLCMSVQEVRAEVASTFLKWYDKFVSVFYIADTNAPEYIEEYKEPMLQPVGTERGVRGKTEKLYYIAYLKDTSEIIAYYQTIIKEDSVDIDSEHECVQRDIRFNGYEGKLFEYSNGEKTLVWQDGKYSFLVKAYIPEIGLNTMMVIAESVQ